MLYIVPTPIGNLGDMTFRAVEVLKTVDHILAEDTRTSKKLLQHYDITTPLRSYHAHNEHKILSKVIAEIQSQKVALISDAGTPGISDPGYLLIREVIRRGLDMEILPGANAVIPGLLLSGFPNHDFRFKGFLPAKKGRQTAITEIGEYEHTIVLYESPHRIVKLLEKLSEVMPDRMVSVSREITKLHEETLRGTASEVTHILRERPSVKGEIVVCIAPIDFNF
jgi:16S rRNA (cytidine1402-2'-O)-methyltransferase